MKTTTLLTAADAANLQRKADALHDLVFLEKMPDGNSATVVDQIRALTEAVTQVCRVLTRTR